MAGGTAVGVKIMVVYGCFLYIDMSSLKVSWIDFDLMLCISSVNAAIVRHRVVEKSVEYKRYNTKLSER